MTRGILKMRFTYSLKAELSNFFLVGFPTKNDEETKKFKLSLLEKLSIRKFRGILAGPYQESPFGRH